MLPRYPKVTPAMIAESGVVLVQQEGETVFLPPLTYHSVFTGYPASSAAAACMAISSGVWLADDTEGSHWRTCLNSWVQSHQTGHRHGTEAAVHKQFAKFLTPAHDREPRKPSKRQKRKAKGKKAMKARWKH